VKQSEIVRLAEEFIDWCNNVPGAPGFRNSPDHINLKFWIEERSGLIEWDDDLPKLLLTEMRSRQELNVVAPIENLRDNIQARKDGEEDMTRHRDAKGRPAEPTLKREINPRTLQGRIISFCMDISDDVKDVMREFKLERSAVMSNLNVVSKNSGIGYSVTGDTINITLPNGCVDPFELSF